MMHIIVCYFLLFSGSCPIEGQIKQECKTCPATCSEPDLICTKECITGCGCPAGQLIDTSNNKCVEPDECPLPASECAVS